MLYSSENSSTTRDALKALRSAPSGQPAPAFSLARTITASAAPFGVAPGAAATSNDFTLTTSWDPIPDTAFVLLDIPVYIDCAYKRLVATDTNTLDTLTLIGADRVDSNFYTITLPPSQSTAYATYDATARIRIRVPNTGSASVTVRYVTSAASFLQTRSLSIQPKTGFVYPCL